MANDDEVKIKSIANTANIVYPVSSNNIKEYADIDTCKERRTAKPREEGNFTLGCLKLFHTRTRYALKIFFLEYFLKIILKKKN